jgi:hypothetical protein
MMTLGEVFVVYRCDLCDEVHTRPLCPLDRAGAAIVVGLGLIAVIEETVDATACGLLVAAVFDGRPFALAVAPDGDGLAASLLELPPEHHPGMTVPDHYERARRQGRALSRHPATPEGCRSLVNEAANVATGQRSFVERLLKDVRL